jgi:2-polyprenyl-3-methyl-5-hydroxy-6-metoxy-1,4-benzoquinol methylase
MLKRKMFRAARLAEDRLRQLLRLNERPERLERSAQEFWSRPIGADNSFWWHARGSTPFAGEDDVKWQMIGRRHTGMWQEFARSVGIQTPVKRIVDWGCGGGANAVAFAPECEEMWGADVSADALKECERQVQATGAACRFNPVQIEVSQPEAALQVVPRGIDLFHCLYVFEVFPSQEYGLRILRLAHELLRPGGVAFIQIKFETGSWRTRSRRWGYTRGVAHMTSYRVEEFWERAEACGFEPKTMTLLPKPPEVPDTRYAYYFLRKPTDQPTSS